MIAEPKARLLELYRRHATTLEVVSFIGGFLFDIVLAAEIGEPVSVVQQMIYLFVIGLLLHHEILFRNQVWEPTGRVAKVWDYRGLVLHFLLGTLLNIYSIFYIKSASVFNSIAFLALMIGVILANELPVVKRSHVSFKVAMYCICLFSFVSMMFPFALGYVGWVPFGLAIASTLWIFYFQYRRLKRSISQEKELFKSLMAPALVVLGLFSGFYYFGLMPPVPLSVTEQGVFHQIEKLEGKYLLSTDREAWAYNGSGFFTTEKFHAEPGEKIYFYAQIFSPSRFADAVSVQWSWKDPKRGWQKMDRIPFKIVGGRREGFRGYTTKSNYQPGEWRVQVLSANEQEISRLYFNVEMIPPGVPRTFLVLQR